MLRVELRPDALDVGGMVRIGCVPAAIARAIGAPNPMDAERKQWPRINAGIRTGKLTPLHPANLTPLRAEDSGTGVIPFEQLAEWGKSQRSPGFEFVVVPPLVVPLTYLAFSLDRLAEAIATAQVSAALPATLAQQRLAIASATEHWLSRLPAMLRAVDVRPRREDDYPNPLEWDCFDARRDVFSAQDLENASVQFAAEGLSFCMMQDWNRHQAHRADVREVVLNGRYIEWDYWLRRVTHLTPAEATHLMCGLDPILYADPKKPPMPENDTSGPCQRAAKMELVAIREGIDRRSPRDWLQWAHDRGFVVHDAFALEVLDLPTPDEQEAELSRLPSREANAWRTASLVPSREGVRLVVRRECEGLSSTAQTMTLGEFLWWTSDRLGRWRLGNYTLSEAAQVVADANANTSARKLHEQMEDAIRGGALILRRNGIPVPVADLRRGPLFSEILREQDVNDWMAAVGSHLRLAYPYAVVSNTKRKVTASADAADWKAIAGEKAKAFIGECKARDTFPSQEAIGDKVAGEMRKEGILGPSGKPLSGPYIKRHVLGPLKISSADYRQLSTAPRRGK